MPYSATLHHHSLSRARVVDLGTDNLVTAKRRATKEFGGEFIDHKIVIFDDRGKVSSRRVGERRWNDAN